MGQLIAIALATFVSEDLTCLATGALIVRGQIGFVPGVLACAAGIYFGDLLLYAVGRLVGGPLVRRFVPAARLERATQWLAQRGSMVVLLGRFTPGLRLPTYIAAGSLRAHFWKFNGYFLAAALLWTPLLVGATAVLGRGIPAAPFGVLLIAICLRCTRLPWRMRRRLIGWWRRKTRWEFWPPWIAYIPVVPYILYLAVRHRSVTLFTAANPGIPSGGFVGESKSAILSRLTCVPAFQVVRGGAVVSPAELPIVLKPDVGERGMGVAIARTAEEVHRYLVNATQDTIMQEYVGGIEFGVFYCRYPGEASGRILSITEKRLPEVVGDGRSTVHDLILRDERAVCMAPTYRARVGDRVAAAGERVGLVEIGSHCRGAIFLDGAHYETAELREAVDAVAKSHPAFYFGRFDLRAPSIEEFQAGRFHVLELNGVSAEPAHIYDPAVSLLDAYRVLYRHWRIAFEIGEANRAGGARPMSLSGFLRLVLPHSTIGVPWALAKRGAPSC